jgi:hypothetical protein
MLAVDDHTVVDGVDRPLPPPPRAPARTPPPPRRGPPPETRAQQRQSVIRQVAQRLPPAGPGRRTESLSSDGSVTSRIERVREEITPAPLPPSPAAQDADVWFEQVPTNPASAMPDLGGQGAARASGSIGPVAATNPIRRYGRAGTGALLSSLRDGQAGAGLRPPWTLPLLIAATCLAVGMVFGALLFGGNTPAPALLHDHDAGECVCPEP